MKFFSAIIFFILIVNLSLIIQSCNKSSGTSSVPATPKDSWAVIQDQILTPSCATTGCHASSADATYSQHNLVLTTNVAYDNLVNIACKNFAANSGGLLRVKPGDYVNSLL